MNKLREDFAELYRYRELLVSMVQRDLKVRYKNSFFGFLWSLLNPLLSVAVITFMEKVIVGNKTPNISAYILAGYLPFSFFTQSLMDTTSSVNGNLGLIKKNYFPREILPIATVFSNLVHLALAFCAFFGYLLVLYALHPSESPFVWTIVFLPLLLIINLVLSTGLGLLLSAVNVFYEDVKYIVGVAMWMLFFLSPVMSFTEQLYYGSPREYKWLNILNPAGILINAYRKVLLPLEPVDLGAKGFKPPIGISWVHISYLAVFSVLSLVIGYSVFNRLKWKFVEKP